MDRIEEWRRLIDSDVIEAVRTTGSVRLRLRDKDDALLAAVDLSRREKACCDFFDFRLELLNDVVWLDIGAPDDAAALLDGLFALRTS